MRRTMTDEEDDEIEIERSTNVFDDLPPGVAEALEEYVLVADSEVGFQRISAIEFILDEWGELDDDDFGGWARQRGGKPLFLIGGDDDELVVAPAPDTDAIEVPESLMGILAEGVASRAERERSLATEAIRDLVADWAALLYDHEKLVGHLVMRHAGPPGIGERDHDELIELHSSLHAQGDRTTSWPLD